MITGGASGIGLAVARCFASMGLKLCLVARNTAAVRKWDRPTVLEAEI